MLYYGDVRRFGEAEALLTQVIEVQARVAGAEHPSTLHFQANLAWLLYRSSRNENPTSERRAALLERARELGERTLAARLRVLGENHQECATSMNNLASVYRALKRFDRADELQKKDIEISTRLLGEDHPETLVSIANFGHSLQLRNRFDEAIPLLERTVRQHRASLPPENPVRAMPLAWYGDALASVGRYAEGALALIEAHGLIVNAAGAQDPAARQMAQSLANLYEAWEKAEPGQGRAAEAAAWRAKAAAPATQPTTQTTTEPAMRPTTQPVAG